MCMNEYMYMYIYMYTRNSERVHKKQRKGVCLHIVLGAAQHTLNVS